MLHDVVRLPYPHDKISYTQFKNPPQRVTQQEYARQSYCSFKGFGDTKDKSARCDMEFIEHQLVAEFIPAHGKVLEVGARFGTTSCAIARKVFGRGSVVSIEPDERVWKYLDYNRRSHRCNFYIVHEPVGNSTVTVGRGNYETIASYSGSSTKTDSSGRPSYYTYTELQSAIGVTFDTILIDCEGCIENLFIDGDKSLKQVLRAVRVIILEADNPQGPLSPCSTACVDYEIWLSKFKEIGFRLVRQVQDTKFKWIYHYVLERL